MLRFVFETEKTENILDDDNDDDVYGCDVTTLLQFSSPLEVTTEEVAPLTVTFCELEFGKQ